MKTPKTRTAVHRAWPRTLALPLLLAAVVANAATDLADVPLFTSSSSAVKPNIMFILDDSGSMARNYMPDEANFEDGTDNTFNTGKYGGWTSQCNGLAYNPSTSYLPPVDAAGVAADNGSLNIFQPSQLITGSARTPSSPASVTVSSSGSLTFRFNTTSTWFSSGQTVIVYSADSTSAYMEGTVSSWTQVVSGTRDLVVNVGWSTGSGTLSNLRVAVGAARFHFSYSGSEPRLGYQYTSSGVITSTDFYQQCNSNIGSTPGSNVFTRQRVSASSGDAQNYANWFAYYRTRMSMTKAAVSLAFKDIGEKYRVGYSTISKTNAAPGTNFLDVGTFDSTQKGSFYTALNAASPGGFTPLRGALAKAGQYFANKAPGQASDPIQYSCQKNFAILSTDGYWNTDAENSSYGPFGVTGTQVGQQDGAPVEFPYRDGAESTSNTVTTWTTTRTLQTQTSSIARTYANATQTQTRTFTTAGATRSRTTNYTASAGANQSISASCSGSGGGRTCTYTVTTATAHGLPSGSTPITIIDAENTGNNNNFNGSFTATRTGTNTYTFVRTGNSAPSGTASPAGSTLRRSVTGLSCNSGEGVANTSWSQTDTFPSSVTTVVTADETATTTYQLSETVTVTPYTRTQVVYNGATISDTTAPGSPTVTGPTTLTPPAPSVAVTTGKTVSTSGPTNGGTTSVTTTGTGQACVSSLSPTTTSPALVAPTPSPIVTGPTATTAANSTIPGPTTNPVDNTVESTKVVTTETGSTGGQANTLADVAMYYYNTDLRTSDLNNCGGALGVGTNVCKTTDIGGADTNVKQNMLTFTLGLGVSGTLKYTPDYLGNPKASDYFDLTQGTRRWPNPEESDSGGDPTNIDDLWHAAVNGRGQYFSAGDPNALVTSLQTALRKITEIRGSAAAAATSTLQPVDGDNDIFVAEFTSGKWVGDVKRFAINPSSGEVDDEAGWSAAEELAARNTSTDPRQIFYFKKGTGNTGALREFTYTNLTTDGLNGSFDGFCSKPGSGGGLAPAQCATLTDTQKTAANSGANLVEWLRGNPNAVYRTREGPLGDVINSSPLYVGAPKFRYTEDGYASFATANANRPGVLYVGANDGMLHAFDRETGAEKWAFMPSAVLPNLYKLADSDYAYSHQFFVDGSPQVGDVFDGTNWRTIIVGGLNKGGKSYYALDVTDPDDPKALWEFSDPNLGFTFGNPVITKRKDGTWVVVFGSGYNNVGGSGDGNGHLFVVDAITGAKLVDVPTYTSGTTPAGTSATPSGLAKINAYIASEIDNTAVVFYGGDLLGNVWRFDIDSNVAPFGQAHRLASLVKDGIPQPITTKPEIAEVNYQGTKVNVIYVGTGRYLGTGDLSNTDDQSVYALKDTWGSTSLGDVRSGGTLVTQTISSGTGASGPIRTASTNPVDWTAKNGWMVDLPSAGERVNVNMVLALNVLSVATNIPTTDVCDAGGRSWLYKFDIGTGSAVSNANDGAVAIPLGNVLVAGQTVVQLPDGRTVTISTLSDTSLRTDSQPPPPVAGTLRRTSWRELAN